MDKIPPLYKPFIDGTRTKRYPKGQIMLYQGDPPTDVIFLKAGVIKIYDIDDQGNEKILHLVKPWAVTPLAFFSGESGPMHWFYSALTDCDVCVIPTDELSAKLRANNDLAIYMMNWFSQEVHELLVRLSSMGKTNAKDKLNSALAFLVKHHAEPQRGSWWRVNFPVNHQFLADMTGLTRESVAMNMKQLHDKNLARNPRLNVLEINIDKFISEPKKHMAVGNLVH